MRRITDGGPYAFDEDGQPAWSPDGRRIAFVRQRRVWVMDADGSNPRVVTDGENPSWTPDGQRIVISRLEQAPETVGNQNLFMVSLDGNVAIRLTSSPEDEVLPDLSPDGLKVVFTRRPSGDQQLNARRDTAGNPVIPPGIEARTGIYSLVVPGGPEERLLSTDVDFNGQFGARISPEGRRLTITIGFSLYTVGTDGRGLRRLTDPYEGFDPTWAGPDLLVYSRTPPGANTLSSLVRLDLDASARRTTITPPSTAIDAGPDWSPPGGLMSLPPLADSAPPGVALVNATTGRQVGSTPSRKRATASAARAVRRGELRFLATDPSGLRRVRVAFGRKTAKRCRFLRRRGYTRRRSCRRPAYLSISGKPAWRGITKRLRSGRYLVYLRTRDGRGNRTKSARRLTLRVRR